MIQRQCLATLLANARGSLLCHLRQDVADHHAGPGVGQRLGGLGPKSARRASHQGNLAGQAEGTQQFFHVHEPP